MSDRRLLHTSGVSVIRRTFSVNIHIFHNQNITILLLLTMDGNA